MNLKMTLWACVLIFCPLWSASAQHADSLEDRLTKPFLDIKEHIRVRDDLSWFYIDRDMQRSISHSRQGLQLAQQSKDELMIATFNRNIGVAFYMGSVYDSARFYLDYARSQAENLEDERLKAVIHVAIGNLAQVQSRYYTALDEYLKALAIFERSHVIGDLPSLYSNIGAMYQNLHNFDLALKYFELARETAVENGDDLALAGVYVSLSDIALTKGEPLKVSLDYAREAIRLNTQVDQQTNLCISYLTLAKVYYSHGDYTSALPPAEKGLEMAQELAFPSLIAHAKIVMSNLYLNQDDYLQAVAAAEEVLSLDTSNASMMINAYANLAVAHAHLGRPAQTELYLDRYREEVDRFANQHYQNSLSELEVIFESEKRELKINNLENQRQYLVRLGVSIGLILLFLLGWLINRYRLALSRRKLAEAESQRLEKEKQLIAVQATLDGEAAERSRLARDLHDGLGSMLSVVKLNLPQMEKGAVLENLDVERFRRALGMLDDSIQELRRVAHHMMPESLLRFGLKVSLSDFCDSIPSVRFHYFGNEERLSENLEVLVYRCIHELVTNALKHAAAEHIHVQLVQEDSRISFTVQDDGIGFDPEKVLEGMGLNNIRQRVASFQGKLSVYSSETGTEVHVEIDLTRIV